MADKKIPKAWGTRRFFGDELKWLRVQSGFSTDEIARRIGIAQPTIVDLEGLRNGKLETIQKLFNFYGKNIEFYINGYKGLPLHEALKQTRIDLNLTQKTAGEKGPINQGTIRQFEAGRIKNIKFVFKLIIFYKKKIKYRIY